MIPMDDDQLQWLLGVLERIAKALESIDGTLKNLDRPSGFRQQ